MDAAIMVRDGSPAEKIIAAAERKDTVIAMATYGFSGLRRWVLDSVADKVLHASTVPLLLMRAQPNQAESR